MTGVTEVGPGDYIKTNVGWKQIKKNPVQGASPTPRSWEIVTTDGKCYGMWDIYEYARASERV